MEGLLDLLLGPFSYAFMQRGFLAALIVGVICAVIGCYVVLRGMAFLGDALAHAVLPGVAVAYLLRVDLLAGALVAAVAVAFGIGFFSERGKLREDTAIGILFAGALALGVALMSTIRTYSTDLTHVLFGDVLGVAERDLWLTGGLGIVALGTVALLYKEFLITFFDPVLGRTLLLPVNRLRNLMLLLLALTIVMSLQTVGVGLVVAMLVTPAATAQLLTRRLPTMMLIAAVVGATSAMSGLYL
ncbi:MAG: metal ABC transporter permease, partial [Dehalococcoidales bacterium]|nr:metal ABC transporter permease [Dehalococcoidales bacterium]